ncbi:MAG: hypothetical protein PHW82_12835 [Bacteroidales bacterium]|nr:hypothetical protein [Bacteroidales bacterium]
MCEIINVKTNKKLVLSFFTFVVAFSCYSISVYASFPVVMSTSVDNQVRRNDTFSLITTVVAGNATGNVFSSSGKELQFDVNRFNFISFTSDYLGYNENTQTLDFSKLMGGGSFPFYVGEGKDNPKVIWVLTLSVKKDAPLGETEIFGQTINVGKDFVEEYSDNLKGSSETESTDTATPVNNASTSAATEKNGSVVLNEQNSNKKQSLNYDTNNVFFYATIILSTLVIIVVAFLVALLKKNPKNPIDLVDSSINQEQ